MPKRSSPGEDPARDGLLKTPERYEKAMRFLTSGYQADVEKLINGALFDVDYDEMVVVKDIEFFSMCEHYMLPFYGKPTWPTSPMGRWSGSARFRALSTLSLRVASRCTERMTQEIAQTLDEHPPTARGRRRGRSASLLHDDAGRRKKQHSATATSAMLGDFRNKETRSEFLSLVRAHLAPRLVN
jgi:GTP cyclohydrolase I